MTPNFEFDTGLSARAFAQSKFAQFMSEPGVVVYFGKRLSPQNEGRVELWRASGVREGIGGATMVIYGPPVEGERLDALLSGSPDRALAAVSLWIQAVLALGENTSEEGIPVPLWPSAAIVAQGDDNRPSDENSPPSVFFAPTALVKRNITHNDELYVHPALSGKEASAFTAAAMLYRILAGTPPFTAANVSTLHEDMRDGNFLPPHFAVPGLDSRLAALIHAALEGITERIQVGEFLEIIQQDGQTVSAASLIKPLAEPDRLLLEKEKVQYLKIKTARIKTRRFVARNTALLLGALAAVAAAVFIIYSVISVRASLPTTAGMEPVQVIETYYHGFGDLDHQMMEACVTSGAGKNDINAVLNFFVVSKTQQAYNFNAPPLVFPAHQWPGGDPPDTPLFGAADLRVTLLGGDENGGELRYQVDYIFWIPEQADATEAFSKDYIPSALSQGYPRRDFLTLVRIKGNWRIAEIIRE